ncbi:AAA family ATPase [Paraburkholderia sp. BCC1884]|uniref:AAA family ATPase n=1 Tax=Paraburkholderia sp. BCC1884 TaxID=2562668 RepID=UPI00118323F6|nr:AAA family ATPase [Paraburkholderia sp. BCC1884]
MTAPELTEDENLGLYQRATEKGAEWWRVSVADRAENYRLEHGVDDATGAGAVDIDLVVDAENLRAKLKKWRREGFAIDTGNDGSEPGTAERIAFMPELQRVAALATASRRKPAEGGGETVRIGQLDVPRGIDNPLVPRINPAYLFSTRFNDIVEDIVENRRVMLIGHTGAGKTSLIEQVAARSLHGVLRSNMNGQTTVGDFVGFWTVKGGETLWVDGVLPTAMREGLWLIVDEIDFAEPSILAALTAVLEPHGRLVLKEKGNEIVAPHPAFRLFATANAVGAMSQFRHLYQGSNLMNEAFLDRWRVYLLDYLTPLEEADVLIRTLAPHMTRALATTLAAIAADCRAAFAREDLSSAFSTRRLLDWAELMLRTGDPERAAGPAIYAKVSPEDAALIRGIIRHHIAPAA